MRTFIQYLTEIRQKYVNSLLPHINSRKFNSHVTNPMNKIFGGKMRIVINSEGKDHQIHDFIDDIKNIVNKKVTLDDLKKGTLDLNVNYPRP